MDPCVGVTERVVILFGGKMYPCNMPVERIEDAFIYTFVICLLALTAIFVLFHGRQAFQRWSDGS